jgi:CheY-like chemotaxis protein
MNATPRKLLLVEDNPVQIRLIQGYLGSAMCRYFELNCAETLADALKQLAAGPVDAILLDLSLPDSTGADTFNRIHTAFPNVPIVVMTGLEDEELGTSLVQAGAQDYLIKKQVNAPLLHRALRYAIERKRVALELEKTVAALQNALLEVQTLSGLLPICAHCKKIRDDKGYWMSVESYIGKRSGAQFSHGICPECYNQFFSHLRDKKQPPD